MNMSYLFHVKRSRLRMVWILASMLGALFLAMVSLNPAPELGRES